MPVDKLELLKRAKEYMECLAAGTDPLSGQKLAQTDPMGSERLRRCFAFVGRVLAEVIAQREQDGAAPAGSARDRAVGAQKRSPERESAAKLEKPAKKRQKAPFRITAEQLAAVTATQDSVNLVDAAKRLNAAAGLESSELNSTFLADGLEALGFMEYRERPTGGRQRVPTSEGYDMGLERVRVFPAVGQPFFMNMLTREGQQYLLEHLDEVLQAAREAKLRKEGERAMRKAEKLAQQAQEALDAAKNIGKD